MSRALPLGPVTGPEPVAADAATRELAGTVAVFDPPMCCPTGLCGPGVDPALLRLARDLRWLEKHGATVQRFGLAQDPEAFAANPRVAGLMQAFGDGALPATVVNGAVLCHGRYPTREELEASLAAAPGAPVESAAAPAVAPAGSAGSAARTDAGRCCAPGSGCC